MKLLIKKVFEKEMVDNECHLATHMLAMKSTHLFIASNAWESIYIEMDDTIPVGYLRCLPMICKNITITLPEVIDDKAVALLSELFPDKAGTIRRVYMQGGSLEEVLQPCLV